MTPDELKSIPKGEFVVMKTGAHPMRTRLRLFLDWGIAFGEPYQIPEHGQRKVYCAGRQELEAAIIQRYWTELEGKEPAHPSAGRAGWTESWRTWSGEHPGKQTHGHDA